MRPAGALLVVLWFAAPAFAQVPRQALKHRRALIGNARAIWGLDAPVAVFAAQVHQESGWNPEARSAYAAGLAQFTPATAAWISKLDRELAGNLPTNPAWALRALVLYDLHLWERVAAASSCDRWAMALAAYNGGPGFLARDVAAARARGRDPLRWFGAVELYSARARWAFEENRGYPRRILLTLQPRYLGWGLGVDCAGVK